MNGCFMTENGDAFRCSEPHNTHGIKLWTMLIATMRGRARQAAANPDEDIKQSPRACFDAMCTEEAENLANLGDCDAPQPNSRQLNLAHKVFLGFNGPVGPNPYLVQATLNFAKCRTGIHPTEGSDEVACGVEAFKMLHISEIKDSKNPGDNWTWTIPLMRLMNLHIVNYTKLCPIRMSEDAAIDDQVGIALRRASSRKIWVTNPTTTRGRPQQRLHIVIESRADVVRLLLEHLDAGMPGRAPHLERVDEGPEAAPAPRAGGRRRRSLM